jgi:PAS domain S-box-containing protein
MEKEESIKLKALSDIASIDISLEFENVLQEILKITCKTMNAHSGTLMLVDEVTDELKMVSSFGLPTNYIEKVYRAANEAELSISSSPSGTVLKTPLKNGLKVVGLLNVYMEEVHDFNKEEINFVNIAASQASAVVHNALYSSESYLRTIIESSIDGIAVVDDQGKIEFGNDSFFTIVGWPRDEFLGRSFSKMLADDTEDLSLKIWDEYHINRADAGQNREAKIVTRDGEIRYLLISNFEIVNNWLKKYVFIAKDITEHIKLESELKESEAKYRDLFENANDGIYTHDIDGFFLTINDVGCRILECTKDEIIGTHISGWLTPESLEIAQDVIKKYISGETVKLPILLELISKNKKHLFVEFRNRIIKDNDRIVAIHGIARDITEKKMMEQKVNDYHKKLEKSYEELIEADRIKTEFISNITHELLTPLTSIRGFVELLDDETMGKINPEQKKSLGIILRNSDRLIKLIKELLDTLNLDNNKLGLHFGLVSINSILSKSIQDIYPQANDKQIMIIKDIQPLPEIWGDEDRLVQVIMNLLINAIKFTPQKGKITIRAIEQIEQVKISISDTGIGIPADKLMSVFERFYQVDGSSNRKYGGVGLGLSICKSIIDKHYGSIWVQSNGQGSTFHIILPKLRNPGRK